MHILLPREGAEERLGIMVSYKSHHRCAHFNAQKGCRGEVGESWFHTKATIGVHILLPNEGAEVGLENHGFIQKPP